MRSHQNFIELVFKNYFLIENGGDTLKKVYEKGVATMGQKQDISKNSQKLFNYLVCFAGNPPNMQKRIFQQKNINVALIGRTIGLSPNSIKKYWYELEKNNKIIYGNNNKIPEQEKELLEKLIKEKKEEEKAKGIENYELTEDDRFEIWKKLWAQRRKIPCEYYEVKAGYGARNIPKETLIFLNEELQISEQDMKLYQFLLTYREIGLTKMYKSFDFSMMDLRSFLGKKKERKTHISIYKSLLLLKSYGLIDFKEEYQLNSKNIRIKHYILTDVKFYVKSEILNCKEEERQYINKDILNNIEEHIKNHYSEIDYN